MFRRDENYRAPIGLASLDWPRPMPAAMPTAPGLALAYQVLNIEREYGPVMPGWAAVVAQAQSIVAAHTRAAGV
jgi:hypothetical protein